VALCDGGPLPWRAVSCHGHSLADRPLISIHDVLTFLSDLDILLVPPCCSVRLTNDDCIPAPINDAISFVDVVSDGFFKGFVLLL